MHHQIKTFPLADFLIWIAMEVLLAVVAFRAFDLLAAVLTWVGINLALRYLTRS